MFEQARTVCPLPCHNGFYSMTNGEARDTLWATYVFKFAVLESIFFQIMTDRKILYV